MKNREFGDITQKEYNKLAIDFSEEVGDHIEDTVVGNIIIRIDKSTERIFIGNIKKKKIRSFYIRTDLNDDPIATAKLKSGL